MDSTIFRYGYLGKILHITSVVHLCTVDWLSWALTLRMSQGYPILSIFFLISEKLLLDKRPLVPLSVSPEIDI